MKLIQLKLTNIGPYKFNKIDFRNNNHKNITMICGENGAGKTTILKSIKLGLFGSFLYGYKQNSKSLQYINEIKSIITNGRTFGSISLKFSIVEDYQESIYEIKREWDVTSKFNENITLYVNSKLKTKKELIDTIDYINHYFSPKLIDAMMFDGEKVISFIDDDKLSDYVCENIIYLFNLNYYLDLIVDLEKYMITDLKRANLTVEQIQLTELENKLKTEKKNKQLTVKKLNDLRNLKVKKDFEIDSLLSQFTNLGGITPESVFEIKHSLHSLESSKNSQLVEAKNFFENKLMHVINRQLIEKTYDQIENEKPVRFKEYLQEMKSSSFLNDDDHKLVDLLENSISSSSSINTTINLSKNEEDLFNKFYNMRHECDKEFKRITKKKDYNEEIIKELKKSIEISNASEVQELFRGITNAIKDKEQLDIEIEKTIESKLEINEFITDLELKIPKLKAIVYEQAKSDDSFVMAQKYLDVCQDYYDSEVERITSSVSKLSTRLLKSTYRKKDYITEIKIDKDFNIYAYSGENQKNLKQLSAGEKQIFVAAVIVSIIKLSKRILPLVFDTPAGRLDNTHMDTFYKQIMAKAGNQVIILPTSKEINDNVINSINNRISNCFTLEYSTSGNTEIIEGKIFKKEWNENDSKN